MREIVESLGALLTLVAILLFILNVIGGLVAGVWLASFGAWWLVLVSLVLSLGMPWAWVVASMPARLMAMALFGYSPTPNLAIVAIGGFVVSLWNAVLIIAWTVFVFFYFTSYIEPGSTVPLLLCAYFTTMAPLAYMTSREQRHKTGTAFGMVLALVAFVTLLGLFLLGVQRMNMIWIVAPFAVFEALVVSALGVASVPSGPRVQ